MNFINNYIQDILNISIDKVISKNKKCGICININCKTQSNFNYKGLKEYYCSKHKKNNMCNVKSKSCLSCEKSPSYNYIDKNVRLYCKEHKLKNMVDIKHKYCIEEKCKKRRSCNYKNKPYPLYCYEHKLKDMINLTGGLCIIEKCITVASFNYENKKPKYCEAHKKRDMLNIRNTKCGESECNTVPSFNYKDLKPLYCNRHKLENMINVKDKSCLYCNDIKISNPKYKGYCVRCYIQLFPNVPISRNYKIKENHMTDFIKKEFKDITLIYDKTVLCGCSKRRPDVFIDLFNYTIVIECDENQHRSKEYEEEKREWDIYDDLANRPIVFIRFNPDSYKDEDGKKIKSCFKLCKITGIQIVANKKEFNKRLTKLKETIQYHLENTPKMEITIIKLFYD